MDNPSAEIGHFSQSSSPRIDLLFVNLGVLSMPSKSSSKTPLLVLDVSGTHMVENGQNFQPCLSPAFDNLCKFNQAPFRESIVF
jgi:hypothetical protein